MLPGFIDVHVHGGGGHSFEGGRAASLRAAAFHTMAGTTSLLAGLATLPTPVLADQVRQLGAHPEELEGGGRPLGVHLKGPFISPARKGAHDPALLRPPGPGELSALCHSAPGRVRLLTAAPELPGFAEMACVAQANGVIISAGHTDADGPQLLAAIAAGARSLTHTFNPMRPLRHREPGPLEAIVDSDVFCELICPRNPCPPDIGAHAATTGRLAQGDLDNGRGCLGRCPRRGVLFRAGRRGGA